MSTTTDEDALQAQTVRLHDALKQVERDTASWRLLEKELLEVFDPGSSQKTSALLKKVSTLGGAHLAMAITIIETSAKASAKTLGRSEHEVLGQFQALAKLCDDLVLLDKKGEA